MASKLNEIFVDKHWDKLWAAARSQVECTIASIVSRFAGASLVSAFEGVFAMGKQSDEDVLRVIAIPFSLFVSCSCSFCASSLVPFFQNEPRC